MLYPTRDPIWKPEIHNEAELVKTFSALGKQLEASMKFDPNSSRWCVFIYEEEVEDVEDEIQKRPAQ